MKNRSLLDRFESKIDKASHPNGCWLWTSATDGRYGVFWFEGRNRYAHRMAYQLYKDMTYDLFVCHKCDNGMCVNPDHLFLGTPLDNMVDMRSKGRGPKQFGEHNPQAKLTIEDIEDIKSMGALGLFHKDIAKQFGVRRETVGKIIRGERWVKALVEA